MLWPNKKYGIHLINTKISLALLFFTQSTVSYLFKVIYLLFKVSYLQKLVIYIKLFIQDRIPLLNKKLQKPESTAWAVAGSAPHRPVREKKNSCSLRIKSLLLIYFSALALRSTVFLEQVVRCDKNETGKTLKATDLDCLMQQSTVA